MKKLKFVSVLLIVLLSLGTIAGCNNRRDTLDRTEASYDEDNDNSEKERETTNKGEKATTGKTEESTTSDETSSAKEEEKLE